MSKGCPYRWYFSKNQEFPKNCQIIWFFDVTFWQTDSWPSANCQPIVWMVLLPKGIIRRQELHELAESRKQEYGCYNINLLGRRLTANLPNRGKHVTHDGQARCPTWASSVPNFNPNRSLGLAWILIFRRVDFGWLLTQRFCFFS